MPSSSVVYWECVKSLRLIAVFEFDKPFFSLPKTEIVILAAIICNAQLFSMFLTKNVEGGQEMFTFYWFEGC